MQQIFTRTTCKQFVIKKYKYYFPIFILNLFIEFFAKTMF